MLLLWKIFRADTFPFIFQHDSSAIQLFFRVNKHVNVDSFDSIIILSKFKFLQTFLLPNFWLNIFPPYSSSYQGCFFFFNYIEKMLARRSRDAKKSPNRRLPRRWFAPLSGVFFFSFRRSRSNPQAGSSIHAFPSCLFAYEHNGSGGSRDHRRRRVRAFVPPFYY